MNSKKKKSGNTQASMTKALDAALAKRGVRKKNWRGEISHEFQRSKHFGRKAHNE